MTELEPWTPWEPPDRFEEEMHVLDRRLDELARDYLQVPELAALGAAARERGHDAFVVDQTGSLRPRVLLIGEAPGADEEARGEPFVGRSGRLLDRELARVGVSRRVDCYATNPVKHRPVDAAGKNRKPTPREVAAARPFLLREIELIDPLIVVTLGNVPTETVWPEAPGITSCHGELRELPDGRAHLPVVHPSFALRDEMGEAGRMFRSDLRALGELVELTRVAARVDELAARELELRPRADDEWAGVALDLAEARGRLPSMHPDEVRRELDQALARLAAGGAQ